jgi:hypothetical protein
MAGKNGNGGSLSNRPLFEPFANFGGQFCSRLKGIAKTLRRSFTGVKFRL